MENIVKRFLRYIAIDTQSDPESKTHPSTKKQFDLLQVLQKELLSFGLKDVRLDEKGYLYASIPANAEGYPKIGFISHVDTAPDMDGKCVHPRIFHYEGGDIPLNENFVTKVEDFPFLNGLVGEELIVTDGTTLLGADDKAGVAEIMSAVEFICASPDFRHGEVKIAFTSDEEVGSGADYFDVEGFGADFAYTVDGGPVGGLEFENFNAATARILVQGKNVHPGYAKDIMVHAGRILGELDAMLPQAQRPEHTEGYEGFFLLISSSVSVETANATYIIRDHDMQKFEKRKALMQAAVDFLNVKYDERVSLMIEDSYFNMKEKILPVFEIVELAKRAFMALGIQPNIEPIRGGSDGSRLSFMGLPCPNFFTGGYNFHGRYELIPSSSLTKARDVILKIIELSKDM